MKHIFWAHSPIGYEVFRSFRDHKLANNDNSLLITARNFFPTDADCTLGLPEEYKWMDEIQFTNASNRIIELFKKFNKAEYVLYVPQTANFFIRCLIESPLCLGFYLFDEGTAARAPLFARRVNYRGFYKYDLKNNLNIIEFFKFLNLQYEDINEIYSSGVPFYEVKHHKFLGYMSHFEKAFPNENVTKIMKSNIPGTGICKKYALLLMPPFHALTQKEDFIIRLQNLVNSVKTIQSLDLNLKLTIKFHPHDGDEIKSKVAHLFNTTTFEEFCDDHHLSKFREPAFMGFKLYIGYPNSTIEFLKEIGGDYIAF
jgi:hypothetical protein